MLGTLNQNTACQKPFVLAGFNQSKTRRYVSAPVADAAIENSCLEIEKDGSGSSSGGRFAAALCRGFAAFEHAFTAAAFLDFVVLLTHT